MLSVARVITAAAILGLVVVTSPGPSGAAGLPIPPAVLAPSAGAPAFRISVGVQLAKIPTRFTRFRVYCKLSFHNISLKTTADGQQDWPLNDGGYSGTVVVPVYWIPGAENPTLPTDSYTCGLYLLDLSNKSYEVDPYADHSRPFISSVSGYVPR